MTNEEKIMAYDTALGLARKLHQHSAEDKRRSLEYLFPELKEREDEEMINELQGFLSSFGSDYFGTGEWQKFDDWLEKQKEQKPTAEWSEEDEKMLNSFLHKVEVCDLLSNAENVWIRRILKSLRPQPKQEWSKEDKEMLRRGIEVCEMAQFKLLADYTPEWYREFSSFLKSLRNRPKPSGSWKPSEEQMEALETLSEYCGTATTPTLLNIATPLRKLYNDLKEL